jgi:hypothetical protein
LKLKCDFLISKFALKCSLYRYGVALMLAGFAQVGLYTLNPV